MGLATKILTDIAPVGLDFWMDRVIRECIRARKNFNPESVHDLRVALRRCRSIADGFMALDSHTAWIQMKKEGKRLFQQLGALRDTQVMMEWVQLLAPLADPASVTMRGYLADHERRLKESASKALQGFNQKKWASWIRLLSGRARHIPLESMAFQHIALERWVDARALHHQALRNRTHAGYHRLRIGLKKFRYTVENFLPTLYASWGEGLKELQNLLGEMHDLQVLWRTAQAIHAFPNKEIRLEWRQRILKEHSQRLARYREKMLGKSSLSLVWRTALPNSGQIKIAGLERLRAWASFRDPDFAHSELVAKLALQIYDGLDALNLLSMADLPEARRILEAAALLHDVGRKESRKKPQMDSYRSIRRLDPLLGWSTETLQQVALIARFHRGALPHSGQKAFTGIATKQRQTILLLCGILRLANAFDFPHQKKIRRLELKKTGDTLCITAPGYSENDASAEKLAAARHLLETTCHLPILICQATEAL